MSLEADQHNISYTEIVHTTRHQLESHKPKSARVKRACKAQRILTDGLNIVYSKVRLLMPGFRKKRF